MFLYFLPGDKGKPAPERLADAGVAYAFESAPNFWGVNAGPGGQPGVVLSCGDNQRYKPDSQDWREIGGGAWIGLPYGVNVTPADLARRDPLPGDLVELADGQKWLVPIARAAVPETGNPFAYAINLPRRSTRDDDGHWVPGPIVKRYEHLWEIATAWHDHYFSAPIDGEESDHVDGDPFEGEGCFDRCHDYALQCLAVNYRIGPTEADLLGLLTVEKAKAVLNTLIDVLARVDLLRDVRLPVEDLKHLPKKNDRPPAA